MAQEVNYRGGEIDDAFMLVCYHCIMLEFTNPCEADERKRQSGEAVAPPVVIAVRRYFANNDEEADRR